MSDLYKKGWGRLSARQEINEDLGGNPARGIPEPRLTSLRERKPKFFL